MAGKSTYIRQVALLTLLAHVGCFLPATRARIGCVDRIFTRIGASDELHTGRSTFMIEMMETANILHHATERSLVILDEIGRGTSTLDGLSLAWAITEGLAVRGSRTLFATHYHELTALADQQDAIGNLHVAVREWKDRIVFLHHIEPGSTDRSYGLHVGPTCRRAHDRDRPGPDAPGHPQCADIHGHPSATATSTSSGDRTVRTVHGTGSAASRPGTTPHIGSGSNDATGRVRCTSPTCPAGT